MPKVSVIIPVYNAEEYLKVCLDSVINQTLKDIEIICIDDGSTDNSLAILKEYAKKDNRFIILTQNNEFAGAARNKGLDAANGEYIYFMDSDDYLSDKNVLKSLYEIALTHKDEKIIKFCAKVFDNNTGEFLDSSYYEYKKIPEDYHNCRLTISENIDEIIKMNVTPWSGLYKREFLKDCGIRFNNLKCCNDRSFFITTMLAAGSCYLSDLNILNYRFCNKNSLRGARHKNFDCHFKSINIIREYLKNNKIDERIYKIVILKELSDMFGFYNEFSQKKLYFYNIHKMTVEYIKNIDKEELMPELTNMWYYKQFLELECTPIQFLGLRYFIHLICSIDKTKSHKIIKLLGIKFKIKRKINAKS